MPMGDTDGLPAVEDYERWGHAVHPPVLVGSYRHGMPSRNPASVQPVRVRLGEPLTIDVYGADGTRLRLHGKLDAAPDRHAGDIATRLVITEAVARPLD